MTCTVCKQERTMYAIGMCQECYINERYPKHRLAHDDVDAARQMERDGVPRRDIAAALDVSEILIAHTLGPSPHRLGRSRQQVQFYMFRDHLPRVQDIAASFGLFLESGYNAGKGSVGKLLEELGKGTLIVRKP